MLTPSDLHAYLDRIAMSRVDTAPDPDDLEYLVALQAAHLVAVPFENLEVYDRRPVRSDDRWAFDKIVNRRRGGWCFEANGGFAQLLEALGYPVTRLGAAVLLEGPNETVDHLTLEVVVDQPYLVDVGFGAEGPIVPLALNQKGPVDTPTGRYEFMASPQGTTLVKWRDGAARALYRFKRVDHRLAEFEPASQRLQADRTLHWSTKPFATRLVDATGKRITLTTNGLSVTGGDAGAGEAVRSPVDPADWPSVLAEQFAIDDPVTPPDRPDRPEPPGRA